MNEVKIPLPILSSGMIGWLILPRNISNGDKAYIEKIIAVYLPLLVPLEKGPL